MTTILHQTFDRGNYHKLHVLLELRVRVDIPDPGGRTLLMKASWISRPSEGLSLANALLKRGAARTTVDQRGWTPLFHAVYNNRIGIAKALLKELDLDLKHRDSEGLTVLHLAAIQGHIEMARGLVTIHKKCHVDVDSVDSQGMTALHSACARGSYDIAKILVYDGQATQTKRDNLYFKSPSEWLQMSMGVHTDVELFPSKLHGSTRDWDAYPIRALHKNPREPVKTAPSLTIPKPEQIRLSLSPIQPKLTRRRCKSAQISRTHDQSEASPIKSKTFVLTSPSVLPERTSTAKTDKTRPIQRLGSAPPRVSCRKNNHTAVTESSLHELNTRELRTTPRNNNEDKKHHVVPSQNEVLKHIFDVYCLQESGSYRKEAKPPPPPLLSLSDLRSSTLSLDDGSSTRPVSADRKSCTSGRAKFKKIVRMHRAESIIKSLKGIHGKRNSLYSSVSSVNDVNG